MPDITGFIWNLKRLIRDALPQGIPIAFLESQYKKYFPYFELPTPSMIDVNYKTWGHVFQNSDKFKYWFRLTKRKMIIALPKPERDLIVYFRLNCYTQYISERQGAKVDGVVVSDSETESEEESDLLGGLRKFGTGAVEDSTLSSDDDSLTLEQIHINKRKELRGSQDRRKLREPDRAETTRATKRRGPRIVNQRKKSKRLTSTESDSDGQGQIGHQLETGTDVLISTLKEQLGPIVAATLEAIGDGERRKSGVQSPADAPNEKHDSNSVEVLSCVSQLIALEEIYRDSAKEDIPDEAVEEDCRMDEDLNGDDASLDTHAPCEQPSMKEEASHIVNVEVDEMQYMGDKNCETDCVVAVEVTPPAPEVVHLSSDDDDIPTEVAKSLIATNAPVRKDETEKSNLLRQDGVENRSGMKGQSGEPRSPAPTKIRIQEPTSNSQSPLPVHPAPAAPPPPPRPTQNKPAIFGNPRMPYKPSTRPNQTVERPCTVQYRQTFNPRPRPSRLPSPNRPMNQAEHMRTQQSYYRPPFQPNPNPPLQRLNAPSHVPNQWVFTVEKANIQPSTGPCTNQPKVQARFSPRKTPGEPRANNPPKIPSLMDLDPIGLTPPISLPPKSTTKTLSSTESGKVSAPCPKQIDENERGKQKYSVGSTPQFTPMLKELCLKLLSEVLLLVNSSDLISFRKFPNFPTDLYSCLSNINQRMIKASFEFESPRKFFVEMRAALSFLETIKLGPQQHKDKGYDQMKRLKEIYGDELPSILRSTNPDSNPGPSHGGLSLNPKPKY